MPANSKPLEDKMTHATTNTVHTVDDNIELKEAAIALKDAAVELSGHARATVRAARRELLQVADSHPYALAGGAAGVGFVVAGGLTSPATRALVSMGLKLGSAFVVDAAIAALRGRLESTAAPVDGGATAPTPEASSADSSSADSRSADSSSAASSAPSSAGNGKTEHTGE